MSAAADAQRGRGVRARSKVVVLPMSEFPAAALRAVRRRGSVTLVIRHLPPLETIWALGPSGDARAAGAPSGPTAQMVSPGEVGDSNTQLLCQLDTPTPAHQGSGP